MHISCMRTLPWAVLASNESKRFRSADVLKLLGRIASLKVARKCLRLGQKHAADCHVLSSWPPDVWSLAE